MANLLGAFRLIEHCDDILVPDYFGAVVARCVVSQNMTAQRIVRVCKERGRMPP
jgi:hypothetical protein